MKVIKSISINPKTWKLAEEIAAKQKRSISNLIEYLIIKESNK